MAAAAGHDGRREPIFKNVNYNLSAHGANTGRFFNLPPNTRIFIPSLQESLFATVSAECILAQLNLLTIDPACSNIDRLLTDYLSEQTKIIGQPLSYKIYDTAFGIDECPNIYYESEKSQFTSGIAECPVVVKQTYLKNYISRSTGEFRQAGDTIIIDNPSLKITEFNDSFNTSGYRNVESMFNDHRGGLKKNIISHLLFPYTKRISYVAHAAAAPAAGPAVIELPNYITYYDSDKFKTIEHLKYDMKLPEKGHLYLDNIIRHYRQKIDSDPTLGHDTVITIITFACNKIDASLTANYKAKDRGISYDEFRDKIHSVGLSKEFLEDMSLQKKQHVPELSNIVQDLNEFFEGTGGREKPRSEINSFFKELLINRGISDATGKIDLHKIGFIEELHEKVAEDVIVRLNTYVSLELAGGSITNKYYLKYLKYKNKYLKSHKSMN